MSELLGEAKRRVATQMDKKKKEDVNREKNSEENRIRVWRERGVTLLEGLEAFFKELREEGLKIDGQFKYSNNDSPDEPRGCIEISFSFKDHPVEARIIMVGHGYILNDAFSYWSGFGGVGSERLESIDDVRGYLEERVLSYLSKYPESLV